MVMWPSDRVERDDLLTHSQVGKSQSTGMNARNQTQANNMLYEPIYENFRDRQKDLWRQKSNPGYWLGLSEGPGTL